MLHSGLVLQEHPMLSRSKPLPFHQQRSVNGMMTFPCCNSACYKCLLQMFIFTELLHWSSYSWDSVLWLINQQKVSNQDYNISSEPYNVNLYPMLSKLKLSVLPATDVLSFFLTVSASSLLFLFPSLLPLSCCCSCRFQEIFLYEVFISHNFSVFSVSLFLPCNGTPFTP